jgi:hypothetical protein
MYTKDGLPSKAIFCKKCVTSNQRVAPLVTIEDIRGSKKDTVYFHADDIKYLPLNIDDFERGNIEVHYLGHFLKWVPQECYYYAVEHTNFCPNPELSEGTFSKYNSIDDKLDGFHYWCGYTKFGIGRCTYEASQEVRNGHIERDEAIALVKRFDGEFPKKHCEEILQYLDIDHNAFMGIADSFRSEHLWKKTESSWKLRNIVC